MIDAYEIGIQLLLQDDVSAGLVVINQGLADVDRAIAVTSAKLAGLIQEANQAAKAVAAVAGQGRAPAVQPAPVATAPEGGPASDSGRVAAREPVEAPAGQQARREPIADAPSLPPASPPAAPTAAADRSEPVIATNVSMPAVTVSPAPVNVVAREPARSTTAEVISTPSVSPSPPVAPPPSTTRQEPVAAMPVSSVAAVRQPILREVSSPNVMRGSPVSGAPVAVTAAVNRSLAPAEASGRGGSARHRASPPEARRREQPVAPGGGSAPQARGGEPGRAPERAAGASSSEREQGQSAGGSVTLDGRLVGRWLTDHMAGEASRPPSGTTFFDARQTPAWNVSGAI